MNIYIYIYVRLRAALGGGDVSDGVVHADHVGDVEDHRDRSDDVHHLEEAEDVSGIEDGQQHQLEEEHDHDNCQDRVDDGVVVHAY